MPTDTLSLQRSPAFPLELYDIIIDFLHHDQHSLSSCGLVCKDWLPTSRFHLFRSIGVTQDNYKAFLLLFNSSRITFIPFVRIVNISSSMYDRGRLSCVALCSHLPQMYSVETLSIGTILLQEVDCSAILETFQRVKELRLLYGRFDRQKDILRIVSGFPVLERLTIQANYWINDATSHADYGQLLPSSIQSIQLLDSHDSFKSFPAFLHWLSRHIGRAHLRRFTVEHLSIHSSYAMNNFLLSVQDYLMELGLGMSDKSLSRSFGQHVDLSPMKQLQAIHLMHIFEYVDLNWISVALSQVGPWVRAVTITVKPTTLTANLEANWIGLCLILANARLPSIREVRLCYNGADVAAIRNICTSQLPEFQSKGILHFETS